MIWRVIERWIERAFGPECAHSELAVAAIASAIEREGA